jgi:hypothetical protein
MDNCPEAKALKKEMSDHGEQNNTVNQQRGGACAVHRTSVCADAAKGRHARRKRHERRRPGRKGSIHAEGK